MADDDIDKLLREIAATSGGQTSGSAGGAVAQPEKSPAKREGKGSGGRLAFAGISAVGLGVAGWFAGLIMPFLGAGSVGVGAAVGAGVTALIAGPPRWFSS